MEEQRWTEITRKALQLRRQLHGMPEKAFCEVQTKGTLFRFLTENTNLEVADRGSWFFACKKATHATGGTAVALRADMDAVCGKDGVYGHYCGHDGHSSILAGLALWLSREDVERDVYLIFQPAEEIGQGAMQCVKLLEERNIPEIYGLHNIPGHSLGSILVRRGTFACASTGLEIRMTGTPSHAAYPEAGQNPGKPLAELFLEVEEMTRTLREKGYLVWMTLIGMEIGGDSYGVSASDGVLRLTLRAEKQAVFEQYVQDIEDRAKQRADREGFTLQLQKIECFPATENTDAGAERVRACADKLNLPVEELQEPMRWSEDFGYYLQKAGGAFFGVGDGENYPQLHTQAYEFPDEILPTAIRMFAELLK